MGWSLEIAAKTDVGRVRHKNEDSHGFDARCGIYAVSDGMGGQPAGEVASSTAIDSVLTYFRESERQGRHPHIGNPIEGISVRAQSLASAIALANTVVYQAGTQNPRQEGMAATLVAVLVGEDGFYSIGHVGDSRIYLVRDANIEQLPNDHSLVMEQLRRGLITVEESKTSRAQHVVMRSVGAEESVQADLDDLLAKPGDVLVLCTDGLTHEVSDRRICKVVTNSPDLQTACNELMEDALQAGGGDNITIMLLKFVCNQ